jgi:hypothetical protein
MRPQKDNSIYSGLDPLKTKTAIKKLKGFIKKY